MEDVNKKLEAWKGSNNPFTVPEGYFDTFPAKIQERIQSETKDLSWSIKFLKYIKPQLALGFIIIAFGVVSMTVIDFILSHNSENVVNEDLYTRIIEVDASEFAEQHFIDVMLEDENKIKEQKQEETDFYINYLVDEDIDYTTLIDEL